MIAETFGIYNRVAHSETTVWAQISTTGVTRFKLDIDNINTGILQIFCVKALMLLSVSTLYILAEKFGNNQNLTWQHWCYDSRHKEKPLQPYVQSAQVVSTHLDQLLLLFLSPAACSAGCLHVRGPSTPPPPSPCRWSRLGFVGTWWCFLGCSTQASSRTYLHPVRWE